MSLLKGKYAPYFELLEDNMKKKFVKCKLCSDGTKLSYHGNTSAMKNHMESKHPTEHQTLTEGKILTVQLFV